MAQLYRRNDSGYWWMAFSVNGRTFRESTGKEKKREAQQVMEQRVEEARKGFYPVLRDARKLTFDGWAEEFLVLYSQPPFRTPKTHSYHRNSIKHLGRYFSGRRLAQITPDDIEQYRAKRLAETSKRSTPIKSATVNREIETLRRMYNVAKRKLKILFNPCDGVEKLPEKRQRRRPHFMAWGEQQKICLVAPDLLRATIVIVTETGLRIYRELASMRKDAVDLERGVAYIEDSKTESGIRQIPLTDVAMKEFAWLKTSTPESLWLFPSPLKPEEHITSFKRSWKTALKRAGVPYFPIYDLRSTFATRLSAGGVSESFVMDLLGHSDPSAMKRYSFARIEHMREALGKLNRDAGEGAPGGPAEFVN
jgi:integrase